MEIFDKMYGISNSYNQKFDEKVNQYLVFLVHVQQSEKISTKDQHKIFDYAKEVSKNIADQTKKYFSNLTDYNITEKNNELKNRFSDIQYEIDNEIKRYRVIIDDNKLFHLENIIETLTLQNRNVFLTLMDISNLFCYKEFDRNKRIDEKAKRDLEESEKKQDMELEAIKFKTFNDLLSGTNGENVNPELFYKINRKILSETSIRDIKYIEGSTTPKKLTYGIYFIKNNKELKVIEVRDALFIEYSINIIDLDKEFIMHIQGKIKVDEEEEMFKIYEKYINKNFATVLNGYRLKKLMEFFNVLFIEKYRSDTNPKEQKNKINDYLSGRIIR